MRLALALAFSVAASAIAIAVFPAWTGSLYPYLMFQIAFILMAALALIGPANNAYIFLSAFVFLGFWGKLTFHLATGTDLNEPVGHFDWSPAGWDAALPVAAVGALAIATARAVQLFLGRRSETSLPPVQPAPAFYVRYRIPLWIAAVVIIGALGVWNFRVAFFQIGVNPKLILPAKLNVLFAWMINWGFAFIIACLVSWELRARPKNSISVMSFLFLESATASVSALSRSAYLFHGLAGSLAWFESFRTISLRDRIRKSLLIGVLFAAGFAVSLVVVQYLRTHEYMALTPEQSKGTGLRSKDPSKSVIDPAALNGMMLQIPYLFVNRWVGLEAVLVVSSHSGKSPALLLDALREDPKRGVDTIFQRMANTLYQQSDRFTFLTLAGSTALLYYSGSLAIVAAGMFLLTILLLCIDAGTRRWTGNPFVASLASVAMAYTVTQVTFPYLALIFFAQLACTVAAIGLIERLALKKQAGHLHEQ